MLKTLSLVLPILIPSWRFFQAIEPSPRVQWALSIDPDTEPTHWNEFRPRPQNVHPLDMLYRLFWNAQWNDYLFTISCAERIQQNPNDHSIAEINQRILNEIKRTTLEPTNQFMQFRLVFVHRSPTGISKNVEFLSQPIAFLNDTAQCR